jgi:hypothetical protein
MFDEELSKNAIYMLSPTLLPIELADTSAMSALVKENSAELKFNLEHNLLNNKYKEFSRKPVHVVDDKDSIGGGSKFIAAVEKRDVPQVVITSSSNVDHNNTVNGVNDVLTAPSSAVAVEKDVIADSKSNIDSSSGRNDLKTNHNISPSIPINKEAETNERKIFNMIEVTNANRENAIFYLSMYEWDLDRAIAEYFNSDSH